MKLAMSYQHLLDLEQKMIVSQKKEFWEIVTDWETKNSYRLSNVQGEFRGAIVERPGGWSMRFKRLILRSHRPLEIDVMNEDKAPLLFFFRPFFFFFSDLNVRDDKGCYLGSVKRRFGIIYKKYDLLDEHGEVFGYIRSPLWRLWHFPIFNLRNEKVGEINKKWQGVLKEALSDADSFAVDFGNWGWKATHKSVMLAAALSIDFDFFENNQGKKGGIF